MADDSDDAIRERLRVARARYKKEPAAYDPALVPTADLLGPRRLDSDLTKLKERIDREVSIFDIYSRFMPAHKVRAAPRAGQRESIKFSCPNPSHPDEHPSAWTNIDGLWYCEPCGAKGDKYTVAAIGSGLDTRHDFREVCIRIADAFGIGYTPTMAAPIIYVPSEPDAEPEVLTTGELLSTVPWVPWRDLYPVGTFMRTWLDAVTRDDLPEEYHVWLGHEMLGLAIGRDAWLVDQPLVFGNYYICLYGHSGIGKSRAMGPMKEVLRIALPYDHNDPLSKGTYQLGLPGSAESLVDAFHRPIIDASTGAITGFGSVRGVLFSDELASLLARGDLSARMKAQLTTMYDQSVVELRARHTGVVRAEGVFCCIVSSTQPGAVADILKHTDLQSGFANRIIFVMGTPKKLMALRNFTFDPTDSAHHLARVRSWASMGRAIHFDADGRAVFEEFFERMLEPAKMSEDAPLFARIDLTIKKLILVMCANEHSDYATAEIVGKAIRYFDYLRYCYEQLGNSVTLTTEEETSLWVIGAMERFRSRTGRPPTARDLTQVKPKKMTTKQLNEGLQILRKLGRVVDSTIPIDRSKGGRPTMRYELAEWRDLDDHL